MNAGENIVAFTVPRGAFVGDTYARFRLSSQGDLKPTGAAADGEVEDYSVTIGSVESAMDLVLDGQIIGAHTLDVVQNQLIVTAQSRVVFQALVTNIRRVSYLAPSSTTELYVFATPATSLFGTLIFVSATDAITIRSTKTNINLTSVSSQIKGVNRIELTGPEDQRLQFIAADIQQLNSAGRVHIKTGDKHQLSSASRWVYQQSQTQGSTLMHTFQFDNGPQLELEHTRAWQNVFRNADVNGSGTVNPETHYWSST